MSPRSHLASALVFVLLSSPIYSQGEQPFPTRTVTLKEDDLVLRVDGRVELPRNADITSLRKARILGGKGGGVLEVSGKLELKCVTGGRVLLKDVWIELTPECKEIYLSGCVFEGKGGIRPSEKGPSRARIYVEATEFKAGGSLQLDTTSGKITFSGVKSRGRFGIRGLAKDEKGSNKTELQVLNLTAWGGLSVANVRRVFVTMSMLGGEESTFADCDKLDFVSNHVRSQILRFSQSRPKEFGGTTIKATDFHTQKVVFAAPAKKPGDAERVTFESCWFLDADEPEEVRRRIIVDIGRDESIAVLANFKKLREQPLKLVAYKPPE